MTSDPVAARGTAFALLWSGQVVSLLLSGATGVALGIWVFDTTGSAAGLAAVVAMKSAVSIYLAPVLGAIADRVDRKRLIVGGDLALSVCSALLLMLTSGGSPAFWGVLVIVAATGLLDGLLSVAMAASMRDLRPVGDLTRANGIVSLVQSSPTVVAPVLGAALYAAAGLQIVLVLDGCSFVLAAVLAVLARWTRRQEPPRRVRSPFHGAVDGVRLIFRDGDFARLQMVFAGVNTVTGLGTAAVSAFLLTTPGGGPTTLGLYNTVGAVGMLLGASVVTALGSRLPKSGAVSGGLALAAIGGRVLTGISPSPFGWVPSAALRSIGIQLSNAPLTALWQEQTAPGDQGKVFGARRLLGQGTFPIAVAVGGVVTTAVQESFASVGVAGFLVVLGVVESALAVSLHCSGAVRRLERRRGIQIRSAPEGVDDQLPWSSTGRSRTKGTDN